MRRSAGSEHEISPLRTAPAVFWKALSRHRVPSDRLDGGLGRILMNDAGVTGSGSEQPVGSGGRGSSSAEGIPGAGGRFGKSSLVQSSSRQDRSLPRPVT